MKPSSLILSILLCLVLALGGFIYLSEDPAKVYLYILGVLMFALVVVYVVQAEIDWQWWLKNPPGMPAPLERQLAAMVPYYRKLSPEWKKLFRDRCMMWMNGKEFLSEGMEEVPEEVKGLMAAQGVMLTFGVEHYLLHPYERVVLYPHAFPSPDHPFLHQSETNDGDGVVILNVNPMMAAFSQPQGYYNICLHEYAHAFIRKYPDAVFPALTEEQVPILNAVRGFTLDRVRECVGMKEVCMEQVMTEHFFTYPERFKQLLPGVFSQLCRLFNQDPTRSERPVLDKEQLGENPIAGM